jgi:hypothetical protein
MWGREFGTTKMPDRREVPQVHKANEKPSRWVPGGLPIGSAGLCANYIGRLKALGALEQVKLHGFAFV